MALLPGSKYQPGHNAHRQPEYDEHHKLGYAVHQQPGKGNGGDRGACYRYAAEGAKAAAADDDDDDGRVWQILLPPRHRMTFI